MKKFYKIIGIEWIIPFFVLIFVDPSLTILGLMFIGPVVAVVFYIMNFVKKKYEQRTLLQQVFNILRVVSVFLAIAVSILIIRVGIDQKSPNERFESLILSPIPASVQNIKVNGNLSAMGSSSFSMTFSLSSNDFSKMMGTEKFEQFKKQDIDNIGGRRPKFYKDELAKAEEAILNASEMYVYEHPQSSYRFDILITNEKHDQVYYASR